MPWLAVVLNNGRCYTNGWAEQRPNAAHRLWQWHIICYPFLSLAWATGCCRVPSSWLDLLPLTADVPEDSVLAAGRATAQLCFEGEGWGWNKPTEMGPFMSKKTLKNLVNREGCVGRAGQPYGIALVGWNAQTQKGTYHIHFPIPVTQTG